MLNSDNQLLCVCSVNAENLGGGLQGGRRALRGERGTERRGKRGDQGTAWM